MAGGQERILRRRIRSVQSTRKITKAMELIAASRIVRAQARIAANRAFREGMERVLRLTAAADSQAAEKLLGTPETVRHVGILAITGDRGLAGSYNSGVLRATERRVAEHKANGAEVTVWSVGKKAPSYFRYRGIELAESFVGFADRPEFSDARHVAAVVAAPFVAGEVDLIEMISTRFVSAGIQRVERMQLLPLPLPETDEEAPSAEEPTLEGPSRQNSWWSWHLARSRPRSSPRCWRGAPRSSPRNSGPWPPPPRTRTNSFAP
jgi:F-type H+-transporting ATPase subunit gamma